MIDSDIYNVVLFQTMHNFIPSYLESLPILPKKDLKNVNKHEIEHQSIFMPKTYRHSASPKFLWGELDKKRKTSRLYNFCGERS